MGRGRVQMKKIENKINRQVTFSKRRAGLIKKAHEISVLCDADVALIVFSNRGKLFQYSSDACMEKILERYERYSYAETKLASKDTTSSEEHWTFEYAKLKAKIELLESNHRHYLGQDLDEMSMKEIQSLEHQMDVALKRVRARENHLMNESISELQKKGKEMQEQNNMLIMKIKEKEQSRVREQVQLQEQNQINSHECLSQGDELRITNDLELTLERL